LYIPFRTVHALFSFIALVHCVAYVGIDTFAFFRWWGDNVYIGRRSEFWNILLENWVIFESCKIFVDLFELLFPIF